MTLEDVPYANYRVILHGRPHNFMSEPLERAAGVRCAHMGAASFTAQGEAALRAECPESPVRRVSRISVARARVACARVRCARALRVRVVPNLRSPVRESG